VVAPDYRQAIAEYIRREARPPEKYSHQPRLYQLATQVGAGYDYADAVLYAAAWLHDLGVFIGHRPDDPAALSAWDNVAYAVAAAPAILRELGFPPEQIPLVVAAIEQHQAAGQPTSIEGIILRDADILEQLGAVGILRSVSKVGRDTRFHTFSDAIRSLQQALDSLPDQLRLPTARQLAEPRIRILRDFLRAAAAEAAGEAL
jgi:uncharacterized protein